MVRFARAKGSKASNERLPEEATSWKEMKQQMIESQQKKTEAKVLDVRKIVEDDTTTVESTWANFGVRPLNYKKRSHNDIGMEEQQIPTKNKKKKQENFVVKPLQRKMKTSKSVQLLDTETVNGSEKSNEHSKNKDKKIPVTHSEGTGNVQKVLKTEGTETKSTENVTGFKPKNAKKKKKGLSFASKKPFENIMRIGQREVKIAKFDGFPIKKEDWIRLKNLQKKMRAKNIPEAEIKAALKLERRRAEKALTRERKKVCFHCRGPGHMLSDCPSINEGPFQKGSDNIPDTASAGICFKCGSTEHTHLQCRVVKGDTFRFATCFVCKEQGHISRQCPHNQNGLYPKGGACNICGEVTHLKKDCPKFKEEGQNAALTLPTIMDSGGLEDLDEDTAKAVPQSPKKIAKKVVKF